MIKKILKLSLLVVLSFAVIGCSNEEETQESPLDTITTNDTSSNTDTFGSDFTTTSIPTATIQFGNEGTPYTITFEQNETALTIARNITANGRNLPIYNYDNFDNYEVMQYYDVPTSYNIPAELETVTHQEAGEIYMTTQNRVILFYQDADIPGEYTKIGTIENIDGLADAVSNNPVVEGWSNKLILIRIND